MTKRQLKKRRKNIGLSQHALANLAKVSRYNIALFETDVRLFSPKEALQIENVLKQKEGENA